jgi:hypothetical protein
VDMEVVISVLRIYIYDARHHHRHEDAGGMKL